MERGQERSCPATVDTGLSSILRLEGLRANAAEGGMAAGTVVVDLGVWEQLVTQLPMRHHGLGTDCLHLLAVEKALGWGIAPSVSPEALHHP